MHRTRTILGRSLSMVPRWAVLAAVVLLLGPLPAVRAAAPAAPGNASASVVVKPNVPARQPVGTAVIWTATSAGVQDPVYRFSVAPPQGSFGVVRDFSRDPSFGWTPLRDGTYQIRVTVKDGFAATATHIVTATFSATSRVTGKSAVVSATANPLVALYSAPACAKGTITVQFRPAAGAAAWSSTAPQPCMAGESVNTLVAGMLQRTQYVLQDVVTNGTTQTTSPQLTFTTGAPPKGLTITPFKVGRKPAEPADSALPVIFDALIPNPSPTVANPIATDLSGHLVWYYDTLHSGLTNIWPVHILPGGTVLLFGLDRYHTLGDDVVREIDLAGNVVRETNIDVVNAQLAQRGQEPIYMFHHEAMRLPNGYTALLGATQNRVSGHNVMSDMIVVLDSNFQVVWTWDMFDHFSPPATWPKGTAICSVLCALPDHNSIDWTHGNDIGWSPADHNLIFSVRMLSWVIKVDYQNGHGSGKVIWILGKGGNFTLKSSDPYPWFSLQHNATYDTPTTVTVFDDGNTRCQNGKVKGCQSRGQVYKLDERNHVATLLVSANLGSFFQALGSAESLTPLDSGDYFFAGGFPGPAREVDVNHQGAIVFELVSPVPVYRAYRLPGLSFPPGGIGLSF